MLTVIISSLAAILVNRLVFNLRERAVKKLPVTIETTERFHAALPVLQQPLSTTSVQNPSFFVTVTCETVTSVSDGESCNQQVRTMDLIGYETEQRSHVTLSVRRQQPATSTSVVDC